MYEDPDDDQRQQQDINERELRAIGCLIAVQIVGLEETANELAALLGLLKTWKQTKEQLLQRAA